jgi:hypothetical protein
MMDVKGKGNGEGKEFELKRAGNVCLARRFFTRSVFPHVLAMASDFPCFMFLSGTGRKATPTSAVIVGHLLS